MAKSMVPGYSGMKTRTGLRRRILKMITKTDTGLCGIKMVINDTRFIIKMARKLVIGLCGTKVVTLQWKGTTRV